MQKTYPLELENAGEDTYEVMSFGHHDLKEFARLLLKDFKHFMPMGKPRHIWLVRYPKKGYRQMYKECDPDHPRAVPATWSSETWLGDTESSNFYSQLGEVDR